MDPYEQYLADAEYEDYLRQVQAEQPPPPQQDPGYSLGPDYNQSIGMNALRGGVQAPFAAGHMVKDVYNLANPWANNGAGGPIDTIANAGAEKTIDTIGSLAAGTAGAGVGAGLGTWAGSLAAPFTAGLSIPVGAVLGGAGGFGLGLMGYDFGKDATSGTIKPAMQYAKDLAYNTGQGSVFGGIGEAAGAVGGLRSKPGAIDARVADTLTSLEPDLATKIDANGYGPQLFNQSLAEMVGSDKLKGLERVSPMASLDNYGMSEAAKGERVNRQLKYLDSLDQSTLTPADTQATIRAAQDQGITQAQTEVARAQKPVDAALEQLPLPIDTLSAGNAMREAVQGGLESQKGKVTAGFEGIGDGVVDPTGIAAVAIREIPNYFREVGAKPSGPLSELAGQLSREGEVTGLLDASGQPMMTAPTYTMKDMQALRSKAIEVAKGGDRRSGAIASNIMDAIDTAVNEAVTKGDVTPEAAASWRSGIAERNIQGRIFENKGLPTKSVLAKEYSGASTVQDSVVPSKYFKSGERGAKESVQNYKQAVGNNDAALEPMYRYATDSFRAYAVKDGVVNSAKANTWLRDHSSALSELPDLRRQLSDVHSRQQFLNEKFGDLQRTQAETEKGALQYFLKVDPEKAVPAMLSSNEMIKRTKSTVQYLRGKDPDALGGLRRGVIEHLKNITFDPAKSGGINKSILEDTQFEGTASKAALTKEWKRIRPALEQSKLFTDSQLKGFDILNDDMNSAASIAKAKVKGDSGTAQNTSVLAAFKGLMNKEFLKKYPKTQYIVAVLEPVLKQLPQAKFEARLQEALLDPRLARDLLNKSTGKNFTRSAQQVFKDEIAKAFGDTTPGAALVSGAATALPYSPTLEKQRKKPTVPKQQTVTAKQTFPNPAQLLRPPAPGKLKKVSFDTSSLSPETQARIGVESGNDPYAVSPKGARGLSQLMPETAQDIAKDLGEQYMPLTANMTPEQRAMSIDQNIRFGDHYRNVMLPRINKAFKKPTLAWAAYNAGPKRVEDAMMMAGSTRDVNKILSSLPKGVQKETVPYVNKIMERLTQKG